MTLLQKHEDKYSRFLIFAVFYTSESYSCKCPDFLETISKPVRIVSNKIATAKIPIVKGMPSTKALTCMKIYLYKQKWQFCQGDLYFWLFCCMSNFCISHRLIYIPTYSSMLNSHFWLLPGLIPFASVWHAG